MNGGPRASLVVVSADFYRVLRYAHAWGVRVVMHDAEQSPAGVYNAPASFAWIEWETRTIYWCPRECVGPTDPSALLHELAHCLDPKDPGHAEEATGAMLAFEFYSARRLRLGSGWSAWMENYGLDPMCEWGQTTRAYRHVSVNESLLKAEAAGVLTSEGKPTFRRPPWMSPTLLDTHPSP